MEENYWTRSFRNRVSRRRLLQGITLGGIGIAALGCQQQQQPAARTDAGATAGPTKTSQPKYGGTLQYVSTGTPSNLDLHTQTTGEPFYYCAPAYSGLLGRTVKEDFSLELNPDLAEKWEQPDETTYVFQLRKGVKWHNVAPVNGRDFTSADVKYSLERIGTDKPQFARKTEVAQIAKIDLPDTTSVKITMKEPVVEFLLYLADPYNVMVPKEVADSADGLKARAIGTGPFILKEYRPEVGSTFVKNPDYFIKGQPYLDGIETTMLPDQETMITAFRGGKIDISASSAGNYLRKPQVDLVKQSVPNAVIHKIANLNVGHIRFNCSRPPFNDVRVRKAVDLAIDRKAFIDTVAFGEAKPTPPLPWGLGEWALPDSEVTKQDLAKAKQLMAEAGFANGFTTTNVALGATPSPTNAAGIALLEQQLKQVNITVNTKNLDYAPWLQALAVQHDFDVNLILGVLGFTEPGTYLETYYYSKGGRAYTPINDAQLDGLIEKQSKTFNKEERKKLIFDAQRRVQELSYYAMVLADYILIATQPYVRGFRLDYLHGGNLRYWGELWLDK